MRGDAGPGSDIPSQTPQVAGERERASRRSQYCKVLAVVEAKANVDDIGDAFQSYNKALLWLSGLKDYYDPVLRRTKNYPSGHFDKPLQYTYNGDIMLFTTKSFSDYMVTDSSTLHALQAEERYLGFFLKSLFFVTKEGRIDCFPSKHSSWAMNYIATSTDFDLNLSNPQALEELRLKLVERVATSRSSFGYTAYDMLKLYQRLGVSGQVYVLQVDPRNRAEGEVLG